ncbi:hypothetical protein RFI_23479 [Reticulomyxa filosa]|uniref:C2 domain-containing protein n=1 Tax=Reticulomyxa filosa TaxID=46433 RepID=X6MJ78_RETFI|nr:hypothetical protein RFI_23479 [Reticulomyxa filosa]|eukprot:ETO13889.1 hypothetical protein RFI_23479 [Reticulomyxa filosa]
MKREWQWVEKSNDENDREHDKDIGLDVNLHVQRSSVDCSNVAEDINSGEEKKDDLLTFELVYDLFKLQHVELRNAPYVVTVWIDRVTKNGVLFKGESLNFGFVDVDFFGKHDERVVFHEKQHWRTKSKHVCEWKECKRIEFEDVHALPWKLGLSFEYGQREARTTASGPFFVEQHLPIYTDQVGKPSYVTRHLQWKLTDAIGLGSIDTDVSIRFGVQVNIGTKQLMKSHLRADTRNKNDTLSHLLDANKRVLKKLYQHVFVENDEFGVFLMEGASKTDLTDDDLVEHMEGFCRDMGLTTRTHRNETVQEQIYYDDWLDTFYIWTPDENLPFGQNYTNTYHIFLRYLFLKNIVLAGQDKELNIFRRYLFDNENQKQKLTLSLFALILQILLTLAIVGYIIEDFVYDTFSWRNHIDAQRVLIIIVSLLIMSFISVTSKATMEAFLKFYQHVYLIFNIPLYFVLGDCICNVIIAPIISIVSLFFLLASQSLADVVINSFALTFLLSLDDMVNVFESDEANLLEGDIRRFIQDHCRSPTIITYNSKHFLSIFLSPKNIVENILRSIQYCKLIFIQKIHKKEL